MLTLYPLTALQALSAEALASENWRLCIICTARKRLSRWNGCCLPLMPSPRQSLRSCDLLRWTLAESERLKARSPQLWQELCPMDSSWSQMAIAFSWPWVLQFLENDYQHKTQEWGYLVLGIFTFHQPTGVISGWIKIILHQFETPVSKSQVKSWLTGLDTIQSTANTAKSKQSITQAYFSVYISLTATDENRFREALCKLLGTYQNNVGNLVWFTIKRPWSTFRHGPMICSVAMGNQWSGPMKSKDTGFHWSAPLISHSNWSDS